MLVCCVFCVLVYAYLCACMHMPIHVCAYVRAHLSVHESVRECLCMYVYGLLSMQ